MTITTGSDPRTETLVQLTFRSHDRAWLSYAVLNSYVNGVRHLMNVGLQSEPILFDHPPRHKRLHMTDLRVRRVSFSSPLEIVLEFAQYGAAFAAARGVLWIWDRTNKVRLNHARARVELTNLRIALAAAKQAHVGDEQWNRVQAFLDRTETIELAELNPGTDAAPGEQSQ